MKFEVRIAPVDDGREILTPSLIGNRGRLRWVGVRFLNDLFPKWQALHDKVMDRETVVSTALRQEARLINTEIRAKCAELRARTGIVLIDLPPMTEAGAFDDHAGWQDRVACLLDGLPGQDITLHLTDNDPVEMAALACHEKGATGADAMADMVAQSMQTAEALRRLNAALETSLPKAHVVTRAGASALTNPRLMVHDFLRDIGVSPETMKLGFGQPLSAEDAAAVGDRIATFTSARGASGPKIAAPVSRDAAAQLPLTIFFMVEPGPLEAQAHLLVASLMVHCRDLFSMVGFCRHDRIDDLHPETRSFLALNGVALRSIENTFEDGYPAGNKLIAAAAVQADGWAVFMDTDMCLVRDTSFMSVAVADRPAVCLDSVTGWAHNDGDYQAVADALGFAQFPPKQRLWGGALAHPTYNAGLLLFPPAARGGKDFGQRWLENALILDKAEEVGHKRPWLDTIALAGSIAKERHFRPLPLEWNCTTRMADDQTRILHYHGLRQIRGHGWTDRVSAILAASPSPYDSFQAFMHAHKVDMKLTGDLERRAMRHGTMTVKSGGA